MEIDYIPDDPNNGMFGPIESLPVDFVIVFDIVGEDNHDSGMTDYASGSSTLSF